MNKKIRIILCALCIASSLTAAGKKSTDDTSQTSNHVELAPDEGIYKGFITDNGQHTAITKISFAGETIIDGIKKEHDNSSNRVSLADITSLQVVDPVHESRRYPKQEFARVLVHTTNNAVEELLFPRNLLICAQSQESRIKKSWFLRSIDGIIIKHGLQDPVTSVPAHQTPVRLPEPEGSTHESKPALLPAEESHQAPFMQALFNEAA